MKLNYKPVRKQVWYPVRSDAWNSVDDLIKCDDWYSIGLKKTDDNHIKGFVYNSIRDTFRDTSQCH